MKVKGVTYSVHVIYLANAFSFIPPSIFYSWWGPANLRSILLEQGRILLTHTLCDTLVDVSYIFFLKCYPSCFSRLKAKSLIIFFQPFFVTVEALYKGCQIKSNLTRQMTNSFPLFKVEAWDSATIIKVNIYDFLF